MNKKELENALIFPQGEKNPYGAYFTGQSYLEGMIADKDLPFGVGNVTFEPGCRNHWHIHKDGYQVLLVTAGEGWYQEEGKEAQILHAGDTIVTHAGVKHWHGATKDSWFSHLAITAGEAVWLEEVSDEQYENL
ncbi:Transcriptional regulator [Lactococcus lactis subsp. lactis]|uniref:Cupin domain-containing protein n=2 Tax=Lactococcus lactis TaxID=1358 RepID=A0A2A5S876_LACLH|nr:cupin domain-containing protein [Lactococcus lactis]KAA8699523.1 cupin domain-containing protein [Lactococcus lactis subsp. hordniae]KSU05338.1 Transcriptional regulator [Lactococcus lactis subsp. lactis]MCT3135604.1 cupin domain-containing protein [Lactococcus lactis]PCS09664.1 hypothetical protein RU90_GL001895 [Lactococcus lactis subsp. hordniae]